MCNEILAYKFTILDDKSIHLAILLSNLLIYLNDMTSVQWAQWIAHICKFEYRAACHSNCKLFVKPD